LIAAMLRSVGLSAVALRINPRLTEIHIENMVTHMKTTLNIDDTVMERLRQEAAKRGTTMSALVEAGIRRVLDEGGGKTPARRRKLPSWNSGGEKVDISNRDALYGMMEGR
jgi:hypothetical protein